MIVCHKENYVLKFYSGVLVELTSLANKCAAIITKRVDVVFKGATSDFATIKITFILLSLFIER